MLAAGNREGVLGMRRLLDHAAAAHETDPPMASENASGDINPSAPETGHIVRETLIRRGRQRMRQILDRRDAQGTE